MGGVHSDANPYGNRPPVTQDSLEPLFKRIKEVQDRHSLKRADAFAKAARARSQASQRTVDSVKQLALDDDRFKKLLETAGRARRRSFSKGVFPSNRVSPQPTSRPIPSNNIKPIAWRGSGGAVRTPPFDYWHSYDWITESADGSAFVDLDAIADQATGYLEFGGGSSTSAASTVVTTRKIGIYVSPPNAGLLTFYATTIVQGYSASADQCFGSNSFVISSVLPEVWEIENGADFSSGIPVIPIEGGTGFNVFFQNQGSLLSPDYGVVTGGNATLAAAGLPFGQETQPSGFFVLPGNPEPQYALLNATVYVDTDHYYILWVDGGADISASGLDSFGLTGSVAGAVYGVIVQSMSWSLQP